MKSLMIVALLGLVIISAVEGGRRQQRQRQRGRGARGRSADPDIVASASDNIAQIDSVLKEIDAKQAELYGQVAAMDPSTAQAESEVIQETIQEAIVLAQENPQAVALQPEIVAEKVVDTKVELDANLREARRHQDALDAYGEDMTPEEAIEHHKGLQKYLDLSQHNAEQNNIAIQEEKAIEAGAPPVEVAEIAPAIIAGRRMGGKPKGRRG